MNTDVCNYLFGSILAMNKNDVYLSIALSITVLVLFIVFYQKLFAITFDETFAKATGVKAGMYNMLIAFLTAITIVLGMRMMGAMLISSLIIFPALSSMRIFKTWKRVTICSAIISIACFFIGVVISYIYATPTGASVVMINVLVFLLFWVLKIFTKERQTMKSIAAVSLAVLIIAGCNNSKAESVSASAVGVPAAPPAKTVTSKAVTSEDVTSKDAASIGKPPAGPDSKKSGVVEIKEKMFIAQTNDIYLNPEDYLGKTIKLEGLFKLEQYQGNAASPYCFVIRYGPGCCGNDGNAGFEVAWPDVTDAAKPYPAPDEWVEAIGTLESYEENGYPFLYLALSQLNVLKKRGAEFVTQ
jgi:uncharacterized membrane protein YcgQ (UPF0703/DUF1980 family)